MLHRYGWRFGTSPIWTTRRLKSTAAVLSTPKSGIEKRRNGKSLEHDEQSDNSSAQGKRRTSKPSIPARLTTAGSANHTDLPSFLSYAERVGLSINSPVYKGTHFEYTVAEVLKAYKFDLQRTGRANDLGIDLIGYWTLPGQSKQAPLPVLLQCKANKSAKPSPAMVRELEGAYRGAPSGWRHDDGVLALLVTTQQTTLGVRDAVQRSESPMGVMQISMDHGELKQFLWNAAAARFGLQGLGVVVKHYGGDRKSTSDHEMAKGSVESCLGLTWLGRIWVPK